MKSLTTHQLKRRERILSSARNQLSKHGYEGLNMRDLAVMAEVSTSTLYNLYQSKDALILAALEDLLTDLNERANSHGLVGLEHFVKRTEILAEQIANTPAYAGAMSTMLFNAEPKDPIVAAVLATAMVVHQQELQEMLAAGELRSDTDQRFLVRRLASTNWSVILMWMKGYVRIDEFKRDYQQNALLTLAPCVTDEAMVKVRQHLKKMS
ncbi:MAG: AcrR family transcriptional regulator [Candidatus Azotimanducaceae bacterium]